MQHFILSTNILDVKCAHMSDYPKFSHKYKQHTAWERKIEVPSLYAKEIVYKGLNLSMWPAQSGHPARLRNAACCACNVCY